MKVAAIFSVLCVLASTNLQAKTIAECSAEVGPIEGVERNAAIKACLFKDIKVEPRTKGVLTQADIGAYGAIMLCRLEFKSAQLGGENTFRKCVSDGKIEIKKGYESALKSVKKPAARAALKEYYITAITTLQAIAPQSDERKMNYERRQGDNQNKLDEMWVRFETEN